MRLLIWNAKQAINPNENSYMRYIRQCGRIRSAQQKCVHQEGAEVSQILIEAKKSNKGDDNGRQLKKVVHRQEPGRQPFEQEAIVQNE